jgi:general secretion pathway protein D
VKALDVAARQVQIKVEFVTASVSDVDAFGINFTLSPYPGVEVSNNQGSQADLTSSSVPQTFVQVASGNLVAQMFSSLVQTRGKVVQAPLVTTTNNVQANINVQQQIPYVTTTNVTSNNGNFSNNQQQFLQLNTGLTVTPRINSDDTVTLTLAPQITDISGAPSLAGGPPPTVTESLQTLRTVHSGETMVVGGLVRKSDTTSQSRIPFISDLPFIGQFFRNHVKNISDSELLIFVTPTIVGDENGGEASSAGPNVSVAP